MKNSSVLLALRYLGVLVALFVTLLPIFWMATMAFKPLGEWTLSGKDITWLPQQPTLDNFRYIFGLETSGILGTPARTAVHPIFSSLIASTFGTIIAMICGTLAAYAVSRFKVASNLPLALIQLRLFPPIAVMIPVMVMWAFLGLVDTWWGLSLIYGIVTLPFAFWLMKTFFDEMPREIEEAALVEGSTRFRVFMRITLPMMKAPLASSALFVFILNWSDFLVALLLTTKEWQTLPVYMSTLAASVTGQLYGAKAALGLLAIIPPIVFGIAIQKYLVRGLTFGALKQ
ncbi:carbohydrate ABC transporter permease [Mesorhizobium sp. M0701]|uniref:carbohydrate ABC transporter permease n=1 Tax=Mesorhizobium sp. M0701 TaxID=2956989 RepID=UPI00333551D3